MTRHIHINTANRQKQQQQASLLGAVGDPSLGEIIGRQLHYDLVANDNPHEILSDLPRYCRCDYIPARFDLYSEHGIRQALCDAPIYLDHVVLHLLLRTIPAAPALSRP